MDIVYHCYTIPVNKEVRYLEQQISSNQTKIEYSVNMIQLEKYLHKCRFLRSLPVFEVFKNELASLRHINCKNELFTLLLNWSYLLLPVVVASMLIL